MIEFPSQTAPDTVSGSQLRLGGSKRCEGRPAVILRDFFFRLLGGDPRIPHEPPLSGCRKMPVTRRIATLTNATGFCNAISVLILRREPSPLPVAKPTGFTTVALTALACKIAPICLIPFAGIFGEVHGVDVSGEMIARGRQLLAGVPNVHLHRNSGVDLLVLGDLRFDFAFSFIVFQHIPSQAIIGNSNHRELYS